MNNISLEAVKSCPVCGREGTLLYRSLHDYFYESSSHAWSMKLCGHCGSAYLTPRLDENSIHHAYEGYATHAVADRLPYDQLSPARKLQRLLANGYKNTKFGTRYVPAAPLLGCVAAFFLAKRATMDREYRHLWKGHGRVLDIGFGNGGFLMNAQDMGWDAFGVDVDPVVVEHAKKVDLNVFSGHPADLPRNLGQFDAVTLSHVIEHVHDPISVLQQCYESLKPGGFVWIETPNIESLGHRRFGKFWRGLEAPRHLVLFNPSSMEAALLKAGFSKIKHISQPLATFVVNQQEDIWCISESMRVLHEGASRETRLSFWIALYWARLRQLFSVRKREYIAVMAYK